MWNDIFKSGSIERSIQYCAALYRYLREFAVLYRDIAQFISIDDKHHIKVSEPGFLVAAVERGKEVNVSKTLKQSS